MFPGRNRTRHTAALSTRLLRHICMSVQCSQYTGLLIHTCVFRAHWTQHTAALNTGLQIYIQGASKQRRLAGKYLFLSQCRFINAYAHMHMCRLGGAWVWLLENTHRFLQRMNIKVHSCVWNIRIDEKLARICVQSGSQAHPYTHTHVWQYHTHTAQASINNHVGKCFVKLDHEKAFLMHAKYQTNKAYAPVFTGENFSKKAPRCILGEVQVEFSCLVELDCAEDFQACWMWK